MLVASYHVFLVQAAIFGLWLERPVVIIVQVTLTLAAGRLSWAATASAARRTAQG